MISSGSAPVTPMKLGSAAPGAIALEHDGLELSYEDLDLRADRFAAYLAQLGIVPDNTVAICMERSFDWTIAAPIWSDPVNLCRCVGLFLSLSFSADRASSSRGGVERRWISLIFAGRNRIILIRRELPLTRTGLVNT